MFQFKVKQKTFKIGDVAVGGIPGERPTVLVGSIFYEGETLVKDSKLGKFDKERAEEYIKLQEEYSDRTGNPHMVDVGGSTREAVRKFLDFTSSATDAPILLGASSPEIRMAGLDYAKETGIRNPIVYNSILPSCRPKELEKIKESGVKSAVLMAFDGRSLTSAGRVRAVKEVLPAAQAAGVEQPLIDTAVIDIPSLGSASRALLELKSELGFPAGCGTYNAIRTWRGLKTKFSEARRPCAASANALPAALGADFLVYGPIEYAKYVFPAVALVDAALAHLAIERGARVDKSHPLFKIP